MNVKEHPLLWVIAGMLALLGVLPAIAWRGPQAQEQGATLYTQSAVRVLEREFSQPEISYLLLHLESGRLLSQQWRGAEQPVPVGSLVKPFTALAYGDAHEFAYPIHICHGEANGCWLPRGHGTVDIISAIRYSCNSYFRALTEKLRGEQVIPVAQRFGLEAPSPELRGSALMGIGNQWKVSPVHIAQGYAELYRRRNQPGTEPLVTGLSEAAARGTAAGVGKALKHATALAKTGTAPCTHSPRAPGDGFAVALLPTAPAPLLLLVRVHGAPGSQAAVVAGNMLRRLEN